MILSTALPGQQSGGMAQPIGIAGALIVQPQTLSLDEMRGALDAMIELVLQEELARIWAEQLVKHDLEKSLSVRSHSGPTRDTSGSAGLITIKLPRLRDLSRPDFDV